MREPPKNKQTDGSTRNRPFVILSWKGKGGAHILYRSPAETILSGQPFPVSGYCFADLLCSLFRFLRGKAEIIGIVKKTAHLIYSIRQPGSDFLSTANA